MVTLCPLFVAPARAFSNVPVGAVLPPAKLATLQGEFSPYFVPERVSVFVFFRPDQEFSESALTKLTRLHRQMRSEPIRWVALVSDSYPRAQVEAFIEKVALPMPVLVDRGDALYGRLGVMVHPSIGIAKKTLVAYEPFRKVNYMTVLEARIRHALGTLSDDDLLEALDPKAVSDGGNRVRARRYFNLARRLFTLRSYRAAFAALDKRNELDSPDAAVMALTAALHARVGDCERANAIAASLPQSEPASDGPLVTLYRAELHAACREP